MSSRKKNIIASLIIILLGVVFYLPFIGSVHLFDWDEINFAESAREMILTEDYLTVQIDFEPFWEKPPLFFWMQTASMKLFGINEFAARFPNVICGILTLLMLFFAGNKLYDFSFGSLWALSYFGATLPFLYFKSGLIDPWFNFFIFAGILSFIIFHIRPARKNRWGYLIISAVSIGLGVLTKGPVALLLFGLTGLIFIFFNRFKIRISFAQILVYILVFSFVGGFWFILQAMNGNYDILVDFIEYQVHLFQTQDAGHGGFPGYHFIVVFLGMFPVAAYALKGIFKSRFNDPNSNEVKKWMVILLMIVLILFSIVKTKIVHYSSMAYFPVSFLATYAIYYIRNNRQKFSKWISGLNIFSALLFVFITAGLAFFKHIKPYVLESNILKDPFAEGNLEASANWTGFEWIAPAVLLVGLILYILMLKWNYTKAYIQITVFNALFIYAAILLFTPRVEEFSQKAAIDFYIEKQDERCYVETIGFKSYADLFYTRKKLSDKFYGGWQEMIQTTLDRPAYFVSKNTWKERILKKHDVKFLKEKNGFCFYLKPEMSSVSDTLKINNNNND